ncbi:MAG TPA: bifunctional demethylmenaquinone methyltransferase/2-methoxy-6-polyprenyl-1,4-benzoquinol methylase UbiE [Puia sp.]|jgi:demethylmenaquinone methyltransferase/2-methoxy-6-polyprenyl-1,4-benzoquinol methylase
MAKYSHDRVVPFKDSELGKKQQVADMFDRIAFRYDFLNRFLSGGIDIYWRRRAIRELAKTKPQRVLDVATGTGDMAIMLTKYISSVRVTGIDISNGMLEIGRQKINRLKLTQQIDLLEGDSEAIRFPDNHFDAVTVAFGVRNFENLEKGLQEMLRVLKPGGRLVVLEFSQPKTPVICQIYDGYLRLVAPRVGRMVSSSREAYQYLNDSVRAFPEGEDFVRILDKTGYVHTGLRRLSLGICSLYMGEKGVPL